MTVKGHQSRKTSYSKSKTPRRKTVIATIHTGSTPIYPHGEPIGKYMMANIGSRRGRRR